MYKVTYQCDGATTEYVFSFPFFQAADICAAINGKLLAETQYSVVPNDTFTGGRLVLSAVPNNGDVLEVFRQVSLTRVIDYQPTAPIDPEDLNTDFNFILAALRDLRGVDIDLREWANTHERVVAMVEQTRLLISDKLGGDAVLGLYNNLLNVLESARPYLINDYGLVSEPAPNETRDDYGIL